MKWIFTYFLFVLSLSGFSRQHRIMHAANIRAVASGNSGIIIKPGDTLSLISQIQKKSSRQLLTKNHVTRRCYSSLIADLYSTNFVFLRHSEITGGQCVETQLPDMGTGLRIDIKHPLINTSFLTQMRL